MINLVKVTVAISLIFLSFAAVADNSVENVVEGIGVAVSQSDSGFVVQEVFSGSAAERGGVKTNDLITAVDEKSMQGKSLEDIVKTIRGPAGTLVSLTLSDDVGHLRQATMIREKFVVTSGCFLEGNVNLTTNNGGPAPTLVSGTIGSMAVSWQIIGHAVFAKINNVQFRFTFSRVAGRSLIQGVVRGVPISWGGSGTQISGYQGCIK